MLCGQRSRPHERHLERIGVAARRRITTPSCIVPTGLRDSRGALDAGLKARSTELGPTTMESETLLSRGRLLLLAFLGTRRNGANAGIDPFLLVELIDRDHRDRRADPLRVRRNLQLYEMAGGFHLVPVLPIRVLLDVGGDLSIGPAKKAGAVVFLSDIQRYRNDTAICIQLIAPGKN